MKPTRHGAVCCSEMPTIRVSIETLGFLASSREFVHAEPGALNTTHQSLKDIATHNRRSGLRSAVLCALVASALVGSIAGPVLINDQWNHPEKAQVAMPPSSASSFSDTPLHACTGASDPQNTRMPTLHKRRSSMRPPPKSPTSAPRRDAAALPTIVEHDGIQNVDSPIASSMTTNTPPTEMISGKPWSP